MERKKRKLTEKENNIVTLNEYANNLIDCKSSENFIVRVILNNIFRSRIFSYKAKESDISSNGGAKASKVLPHYKIKKNMVKKKNLF